MFSDDNGIKLEIYDRGHPWGACRERCGPRLKLWGKWYLVPQEELLKKASKKRSEKGKENQEKKSQRPRQQRIPRKNHVQCTSVQ